MRFIPATTLAILLATTTAQAQAPDVSEEGVRVIGSIEAACDSFDYEEDCFNAMGTAVTAAESLSESDREAVHAKIRSYGERRSHWADDIAGILGE